MLIDSFSRIINYLRISVTDRCNLRCLYCMPKENFNWIPHEDVLRYEELIFLCRIFADLGIKTVRVTGGEPLVRCGIIEFIKELKKINNISHVSMTSNGILLSEYLPALAGIGLNSVNISFDTMDKDKYERLTGSAGGFEKILPAIDQALTLGLEVKINCVPLLDFNEDDIPKITSLAKDKNITVRFIELMPMGPAINLQPLPINETISIIEKNFGKMKPAAENPGSGPASYFTLPGFSGSIGLINVSRNFCKSCNRLRLTSSGLLKPCLSDNLNLNLRSLIRNKTSVDEITKMILELVKQKPALYNFNKTENEMFSTGG